MANKLGEDGSGMCLLLRSQTVLRKELEFVLATRLRLVLGRHRVACRVKMDSMDEVQMLRLEGKEEDR